MSRAASLPGAELFPENLLFGRSHLSQAASLSGADFFQKIYFFYKKPLVPGSFVAWGRTFFQKIDFLKKPLVPGSFAAWGGTFLKKQTFRNSGTPVRRTRRRKSKNMDFQEFWDSCAQNKTSEISKNGLPRILGLLCVEQDARTL